MSAQESELSLDPEQIDGSARLDAIVAQAAEVSRAVAAAWIAEGRVSVDGRTAAKSARPRAGASVVVRVPAPTSFTEEHMIDLPVLYEDEDLIVIDKPVGVAAHPSPGWTGPTVSGQLVAQGVSISTSGAAERQGIVHRLDVGTSGAMAVAKSERAYSGLKQAFHDRTPTKVYHAVVQGLPEPLKGTIDAPIGRHPGASWRFAVVEDGRHAVTHYEVLEAFGRASLVEVHLETGRTHQIRVHFSALHHALVGDQQYGADPKVAAELGLTRQWLHAYRLGFDHPVRGGRVEVEAPYPNDLISSLELLRG
ncbi:RluA family pseudouridine synthase [Galactobacter valiniphilus]|uniref:RluA family pseudouridine synthase n=1 Tax=Galactobacter valiniphilus TaxID=2676122 RepID=UPI0037362C5D